MHVESLIIRPSDDSKEVLDPAERESLWDELHELSGYSTSRYCCLRSLKDVSFPDTRSGSFELVEEAADSGCERIVVIDFGDTYTFVYVLSKEGGKEPFDTQDGVADLAEEDQHANASPPSSSSAQQTSPQSDEETSDGSESSNSDEVDEDTVMMLAHISPEQILDVIRGGDLPDTNTLCIDETLPNKTLTMLPVNIDGEQFTVLITTKTERTRAGFGRGQSDSVVTTGNVQRGTLSASEIKSLLNQLIRKYPLDDNEERFARVPYEPHKPITCAMRQVAQVTGINSQMALKYAGCAGTMMMSTLHTTLHTPCASAESHPQVTPGNSDAHIDGSNVNMSHDATHGEGEVAEENEVSGSSHAIDDDEHRDGIEGARAGDAGAEELDSLGKPRVVRSTSNAPHMRFEPPSRLPPPPAESIGSANVHMSGIRSRRLTVRRPLRHTYV